MPTVDLTIDAPVDVVYAMFTTPNGLGAWICNQAQVNAAPNGMYSLLWNVGFSATGQFREVEPNKKLVFTWWGQGDPAQTLVTVTFDAAGGETRLRLVHDVSVEGETGDRLREQFQKEWDASLGALKHALETGGDLRIGNQPMLGVYPNGAINDENREKYHGVAHGVLISGAIDGMGAADAGLQADDVIVSMNGKDLIGWGDLAGAIEGKAAGDVVDVVLYRDGEKMQLQMKLSARQLLPVIWDVEELIAHVQAVNAELNAELDEIVAGVTEAEADFKPNGNEWNLKENLAHIIWIERFTQMQLWGLTVGDGRIAYANNDGIHLNGIIAAHPTLADMVAEFKRTQVENINILRSLPANYLANKPLYRQGAAGFQYSAPHTRQHWQQMRDTLALARQAQMVG